MLLCLGLSACGSTGKEDETAIAMGPGTGGTAVAMGSVTPQDIFGLDGGRIGALSYDTSYFTLGAAPPGSDANVVGVLDATADGPLSLQLAIIFGRPDTPCRFHAALLARDDGFTILGDTTKRVNDQAIVFYEVLLVAPGAFVRLDCAELTGNVGVEVAATSAAPGLVGAVQVHYVLNSIHP